MAVWLYALIMVGFGGTLLVYAAVVSVAYKWFPEAVVDINRAMTVCVIYMLICLFSAACSDMPEEIQYVRLW